MNRDISIYVKDILENIHLYFGVNLERVWLVVKEDIPQIKPRIKNVLDDLKK